jgi:hypothetical protein
MKITTLLALAAMSLSAALASAPASAQIAMKDFSWIEMRAELKQKNVEITGDGVSGKARYVSGKAESGMVFAVYGYECDTEELSQRCRGADFISSFTLKDASKGNDVLAMIDFAAVGDYVADDGRVKISRYMIFDGGVSEENLLTNIDVFISLSNQVWDKLDDADLLK